jgi:hypothetical protein
MKQETKNYIGADVSKLTLNVSFIKVINSKSRNHIGSNLPIME